MPMLELMFVHPAVTRCTQSHMDRAHSSILKRETRTSLFRIPSPVSKSRIASPLKILATEDERSKDGLTFTRESLAHHFLCVGTRLLNDA